MQPLSRQCQQCLPGAAKLLELLEDQTNRLLNANIGIKTGILLAVFCLACLGILDRPARVRVFPGRLGRIIGPDVRGALACLARSSVGVGQTPAWRLQSGRRRACIPDREVALQNLQTGL